MNTNENKTPTMKVGEASFELEVLRSKQPVVVAFSAPWSRACQVLDSALEGAANVCAASVKFVKVNADDNPDLSLVYDIQSIPTLLYFVDGMPRAKVVGTTSKEAILARLRSVLPGNDSAALTPDTSKANEHRNL